MTGTPDSLLETPDRGHAGAEAMDILSEVLRAVRLSGALLFRGEFSSPWSCSASDSRNAASFLVPGAKSLVFFHVVTDGRCWAEVENQEPLMLEAGDVIALPYGDAHSMGNPQGETRTPISSLLPPPPWPELPTVTFGGGGEVTRVLCGFLHCDDALFNPVLAHLPRVLCVRARRESSWLETSSRYMLEEASRNRPGGASILGRLASSSSISLDGDCRSPRSISATPTTESRPSPPAWATSPRPRSIARSSGMRASHRPPGATVRAREDIFPGRLSARGVTEQP
jgi:hypothetical protein